MSQVPASLEVSTVSAFNKSPYLDPCPVNTLPPELLSTVFILAYPKSQIPQRVPFEVSLSHVSKYWRNVAHGTASLWTTITIYSPRSLERRLPLYLERSGKLTSLKFTIDVYRWDQLTPQDSMLRQLFAKDLAEKILPVFNRVEKLTILCHKEVTVDALQRHLQDISADSLRAYNLRLDPSSNAGRLGHELFVKGAPNLRYIKTALPDCLPPSSTLRNLTTLHLCLGHHGLLISYNNLVDTLKAAKALRYLTIADATPHLITTWPMHLASHDFTMPNLTCLRLLDHSYMAAKFLLSVSAPKLKSLWLHCSLDNFTFLFDAPQMQVLPGQTAKFAKLQYLTVFNDVAYSAVKFANIFPSITHLHLPFANFYHADPMETALVFRWPMLRTLILTMVRETKWMKLTNTLAVALPKRRQDNHPIDTLLVDQDYRHKLDTLVPRIDGLVDIVDLSEENYMEPWWNKEDECGFYTDE